MYTLYKRSCLKFIMSEIDFDNNYMWIGDEFSERKYEEVDSNFSKNLVNINVANFIGLLNFFNTFRWENQGEYHVYSIGYNLDIIKLVIEFYPGLHFYTYNKFYKTKEELESTEEVKIDPQEPVIYSNNITIYRRDLLEDECFSISKERIEGNLVFVSLFNFSGNNEEIIDQKERKKNISIMRVMKPDAALLRFRVSSDFVYYKGIIMNVPFIYDNSKETRLIIAKVDDAYVNKDYYQEIYDLNMNYHNIVRRCTFTYNNIYNGVYYTSSLGIISSYDYSYVIKVLYNYSSRYKLIINPEDIRKLTVAVKDRI